MKKTYAWIIVSLGLFLSASAYADESRYKEVETLLEVMRLDTMLSETIDQAMEVQLQQNPSLVPYRHIMEQFMKKYLSYESIKPELIKLYAQAFTKEELNDITAFYRTPTGQKTIQAMPQLMAQGTQMGQTKMQDHLPELQQQILDEMARLDQQDKQQQQEPQK